MRNVLVSAPPTCPVCKLAIHAFGGGILVQSSIGTFSECHSHVICNLCNWWEQTDTIEKAHKMADDHFQQHVSQWDANGRGAGES